MLHLVMCEALKVTKDYLKRKLNLDEIILIVKNSPDNERRIHRFIDLI